MGQKARVSQPKPDPQVVRDKVVSNLATSLEKAAAELKKEGHVEGLPDATAVARAVEQALQTAFSTDKEYRQKVRSLSYNLRDASNPELRARVLQGEVTPDRLVQMTPAEMASKMAKANYDKGLLTAVDNVDAFAQPQHQLKETVPS
ncbi:MAG: transcription elongation factor s [Trebouxia sp. A1-2]|nr:MAG: transcription elongation factor s [Trebouxia sp. A1-2]